MYACGSPHDVALGVQKMCWVSTLCVGDSEMKKLGSGFEETGRGMGEYPGGSDEVVTVAPGKCSNAENEGAGAEPAVPPGLGAGPGSSSFLMPRAPSSRHSADCLPPPGSGTGVWWHRVLARGKSTTKPVRAS